MVGVAGAINQALNMPDEQRKEQHLKLYKHVVTNTVEHEQPSASLAVLLH
jgi:trehalose 6-phosphate synthase/phosphatase